jgi:hypothetical protein
VSWTCPRCGRTFATPGQSHSHDVVELDAHFAGRPGLRETFDQLAAALPDDVRVEPLRTAIILAHHTTLAYVAVLRDRLRLGIFLDRALEADRVAAVARVSARKIDNVIELRTTADIDDEVRGWLAEAYALHSGADA